MYSMYTIQGSKGSFAFTRAFSLTLPLSLGELSYSPAHVRHAQRVRNRTSWLSLTTKPPPHTAFTPRSLNSPLLLAANTGFVGFVEYLVLPPHPSRDAAYSPSSAGDSDAEEEEEDSS